MIFKCVTISRPGNPLPPYTPFGSSMGNMDGIVGFPTYSHEQLLALDGQLIPASWETIISTNLLSGLDFRFDLPLIVIETGESFDIEYSCFGTFVVYGHIIFNPFVTYIKRIQRYKFTKQDSPQSLCSLKETGYTKITSFRKWSL